MCEFIIILANSSECFLFSRNYYLLHVYYFIYFLLCPLEVENIMILFKGETKTQKTEAQRNQISYLRPTKI